jgi:hypothetical protein
MTRSNVIIIAISGVLLSLLKISDTSDMNLNKVELEQPSNYFSFLTDKDWYTVKPNDGTKINASQKHVFTNTNHKTYENGVLKYDTMYHFSDTCSYDSSKVGVNTTGKYIVYENYDLCNEIETINNDVFLVFTQGGRYFEFQTEIQ